MTNAQQERLIKLMEECAEVIQIASKVLIHGYDEVYIKDSNRTRLEKEIIDVMVWIDALQAMGDIDLNLLNNKTYMNTLTAKVIKYTRYQEDEFSTK